MTLADLLHPPVQWEFQNDAGDSLLTVDVTIEETYAFESQVTTHPVEVGIDIVDHKRPRPIHLSMRGIITDAPSNAVDALSGIDTAVASAIANPGSVGFDDSVRHSQEGYITLRSLHERTDPITVVTQRQLFTNMIITALRFQKNDAGFYIGFEMELIELEFAVTDFIPTHVDVKNQHTAPTKKKELVKPGDASSSQSYLDAISEWSR